MSDEPMYLQRLRQNRRGKGKQGGAGADAAEGLNAQEQEALRWAREAAGTELRSKKDLAGRQVRGRHSRQLGERCAVVVVRGPADAGRR